MAPSIPRHFIPHGICRAFVIILKAMLKIPHGGDGILEEFPTVVLREDWKFPT